jgi:hypothetical protein
MPSGLGRVRKTDVFFYDSSVVVAAGVSMPQAIGITKSDML